MTIEEFREKVAENPKWKPGAMAINVAFCDAYTKMPYHYQTKLDKKVLGGGQEFLDAYSIFKSETDEEFFHLVTYGMSAIDADEQFFGDEISNWGYEMTVKWSEGKEEFPNEDFLKEFMTEEELEAYEEKEEQRKSALEKQKQDSNKVPFSYHHLFLNLMSTFSRYTYGEEKPLNLYEVIKFDLQAHIDKFKLNMRTNIAGFISVPDTQIKTKKTIFGDVQFIQLVGVNEHELEEMSADKEKVHKFIENMKQDNPNLVINLFRTKSYL